MTGALVTGNNIIGVNNLVSKSLTKLFSLDGKNCKVKYIDDKSDIIARRPHQLS
jgi:hypothetical protein